MCGGAPYGRTPLGDRPGATRMRLRKHTSVEPRRHYDDRHRDAADGEIGYGTTGQWPWEVQKSGLPDGSAGLFDPGWDTSQGIYYTNPNGPLQKFMAGYGLGSPFIEDTKLCAALGAYWPGVAPDWTRAFPPDKRIDGNFYPYPTIAPLTDQEIGSAPLDDGRYMPWDGVRGPRLVTSKGKPVVAYPDPNRTDYIDIVGTMTALLTSRIDTPEYQARVMAMQAVYWALGIHDPEFVKRHGEQEAVYKVFRRKRPGRSCRSR